MADYKESIYQRTTQHFLTILDRVKSNLRSSEQRMPPDKMRDDLKVVLEAVLEEGINGNLDTNSLNQSIENQGSNHGAAWTNHFHRILTSYRQMHHAVTQLTDEKKQIAKLENSTHRRNLIYRALTTFVVGIIIMSIYAIAQYFEISMPLMRVPI